MYYTIGSGTASQATPQGRHKPVSYLLTFHSMANFMAIFGHADPTC